ncbi:MAG: AbgT family transporter [Lachnospiraceae bacterium]|jgi:aminobenzoyl-glutamate transport protein|nr:AbgT family transporter [Lachnospiraceae bacterium]
MSENTTTKKKSGLDKVLDAIERGANKLPTPFTLFCILFAVTAIISLILGLTNVEMIHPSTGDVVTVNNFFTRDGVVWFVTKMVTNFTGYAPLGLVLVMTVGIGMLEQTGMVNVLLKTVMSKVPPVLVPLGCAFIGICGNLFSDSCAVIIPPLAALAFLGVGKHPLAGMMCAFLGTQAGFSANIIIAGTDGLLAGITNTVLDGFFGEGAYHVEVVCNWFFMIASTFFLSIVIAMLDQYLLEPRLGTYVPGKGSSGEVIEIVDVTPEENRALVKSGLAALLYIIVIVVGFLTRVLSNENGGILSSPLLSGIIPILFGLFFITGLTYGISVKNIRSEADVSKHVIAQLRTMAPFLASVLASSQFIQLFTWTNIGTVLSIAGADLLEATGFTGIPMLICFIILCAFINLFIGSGSAKWTLMAPIFVPMLTLIGYDPAFIQLAYRIGDSCTNAMSPMSAYLIMILAIAQEKYDKDAKLGTFLSNLVPSCLIMLACWIIFFVLYSMTGLPIGPGAYMHLPAEVAATLLH